MAVTALIPIVLFPWLGVMHSKEICINYLKVEKGVLFLWLLLEGVVCCACVCCCGGYVVFLIVFNNQKHHIRLKLLRYYFL